MLASTVFPVSPVLPLPHGAWAAGLWAPRQTVAILCSGPLWNEHCAVKEVILCRGLGALQMVEVSTATVHAESWGPLSCSKLEGSGGLGVGGEAAPGAQEQPGCGHAVGATGRGAARS